MTRCYNLTSVYINMFPAPFSIKKCCSARTSLKEGELGCTQSTSPLIFFFHLFPNAGPLIHYIKYFLKMLFPRWNEQLQHFTATSVILYQFLSFSNVLFILLFRFLCIGFTSDFVTRRIIFSPFFFQFPEIKTQEWINLSNMLWPKQHR